MAGECAIHPSLLARRIATEIQAARINLTSEATAHRDVLAVIEAAGIECQSEARLSAKDRIDILCGPVGVEIKVGHPRRAIWRQLVRYAALPEIAALVLATGTPWPTSIKDVEGIPLFVADLSRGWL
ncbi:hypothetical protein [Roseovarius nitratireducens]|uniref:hypothetical protein n=1 Tax=Roseovarius nitratireducens TaxID=2044597 RepID=UPI0013ECFA47|nr:hypothetical protein [Roseovarius nitratireducens]